jgi:AhpD family alkylhydroperoxidase
MAQRLTLTETAPEVYKAFTVADQALRKGPLEPIIRELVNIRASQLNGCVFCIDMHIHEALELGENQDRIFQLPVWRESQLFTEAERAALAYTEAATRLSAEGVAYQVWDEAAARFKPEELGTLVGLVAFINTWNRVGVPLRMRPPIR